MAGDTPTVSVIIPTYNRAALLLEALESVLSQTFRDFEVIIVDDGSTDDTLACLMPYLSDSRIQVITQTNGGPARARNRGIEASSGEFIALLDSDDLWLPEKLVKQVALLRDQPEIGLVYTDVIWIEADGRPMDPQPLNAARRFPTYFEDLLYENVIYGPGSSVVFRKSCLESIDLYDEALPPVEDQDFFLRLSANFEFCFLPGELVLMRRHISNLQQNPERMAKARMLFLEKLRTTLPDAMSNHLNEIEYTYMRRNLFGYLLKHRWKAAVCESRYFLRHPRRIRQFVCDAFVRFPRVRSTQWR